MYMVVQIHQTSGTSGGKLPKRSSVDGVAMAQFILLGDQQTVSDNVHTVTTTQCRVEYFHNPQSSLLPLPHLWQDTDFHHHGLVQPILELGINVMTENVISFVSGFLCIT